MPHTRAKCPPPAVGSIDTPKIYKKYFCQKCIPIVSSYYFTVILSFFQKHNVGKHNTEDKNVTHIILAELMGHFTRNEILQ